MHTIKILFIISCSFLFFSSCNETNTTTEAVTKTENIDNKVEEKTIQEEEKEVPLIIFQNSILSMSPRHPIKEYEAVIEKDLLETGEGNFEIFNLKDAKNNVVAYFLPDPNDNSLIGEIYVTSPEAQTEDGIKIGQTFGDLLDKHPDLEVHGSEIEGQTFANYGNLSFKIDEPHSTYDLDINAVSKEAKIIEIVINR